MHFGQRSAALFELLRHLLRLLADHRLSAREAFHVVDEVRRRAALQPALTAAGLLPAAGGALRRELLARVDLAFLVRLVGQARRRVPAFQCTRLGADHLPARSTAPTRAAAAAHLARVRELVAGLPFRRERADRPVHDAPAHLHVPAPCAGHIVRFLVKLLRILDQLTDAVLKLRRQLRLRHLEAALRRAFHHPARAVTLVRHPHLKVLGDLFRQRFGAFLNRRGDLACRIARLLLDLLEDRAHVLRQVRIGHETVGQLHDRVHAVLRPLLPLLAQFTGQVVHPLQ